MSRPERPDRDALAKAAVLAEALPWLERFHGATVVVKYGGNAMTRRRAAAGLRRRRRVPAAGGPAPGRRARRRPADQRDARPARRRPASSAAACASPRPEVMDVVRMVLIGQVQRELVGLINAHGPLRRRASPARTPHLFTAERRTVTVDGEPVDIGLVGDVIDVRPDFVTQPARRRASSRSSRRSASRRRRPGAQRQRRHRRRRAGRRAAARDKLVVLTDVEGLYADWPDRASLVAEIRRLGAGRAAAHAWSPAWSRRWRPACVPSAGESQRAHVIDGRVRAQPAARGVHRPRASARWSCPTRRPHDGPAAPAGPRRLVAVEATDRGTPAERWQAVMQDNYGTPPITLVSRVRARGCWDDDGQRVPRPRSAGIAVNALGHAHPAVVDGRERAGRRPSGTPATWRSTNPPCALAERLARAGRPGRRCPGVPLQLRRRGERGGVQARPAHRAHPDGGRRRAASTAARWAPWP